MTERHKRFIAEYLKTFNATQAALEAGFSRKTAYSQGQRLLKKAEIKAVILQKHDKQLEKAELTATRTLEEMRRLGFSNIKNLFDAKGDLKPIHELSDEDAACIASLEVIMKNATAGDGKIDRVLKIKVWDKPKVMEMLGKHFALLTERVRIEGDADLIAALQAGRMRSAQRGKG